MSRFVLLCFLCLSFTACVKKNTKKNLVENFDTTDATFISKSNFSSNAHPTSGCINLYQKAGSYNFVFTGFKTDNGPDLRVYLSRSTVNKDFIELGKLKAVSGEFNYSIDTTTNLKDYRYVLIWCEDFSVLFGNAQL